jgi:hypothetical protein
LSKYAVPSSNRQWYCSGLLETEGLTELLSRGIWDRGHHGPTVEAHPRLLDAGELAA